MSFFKLLTKIPIFGGLFECKEPTHWNEAFWELCFTLLGSTMPLWLGIIILLVIGQDKGVDFFKALSEITRNGELFIYASSTLAPILYIAIEDKPGKSKFPSRNSHVAIYVVIIAISAAIFGLRRANFELTDNDFVLSISRIFFATSIILVYIAMVYRNHRLATTADDVQKYEKQFTKDYSKHRGSK